MANPTVFDHFSTTPPAKPKGQHGIRIGLSGEDRPRGEAAVDETEQTLGDDHGHDEGRGKGGRGYLEVGEEAVTIKRWSGRPRCRWTQAELQDFHPQALALEEVK